MSIVETSPGGVKFIRARSKSVTKDSATTSLSRKRRAWVEGTKNAVQKRTSTSVSK